ncbi:MULTISPECIES: ABC transporter permease [unclassified Mesorhizobium]|uniref:ABC transporter permease n=1 Tax=unclassified Mesorhizobium TaxID=325217 RepID=UPI000BB0990C|nr:MULTISPECIES: ABC transporter permease [unclassified Mesorhizobium]TGT60074.1 ABC transporter permease [Mesorhizobium sp. M00.F.Ca.ET.170.01.1.1]PBB85671.1 ABC transporter permease [Mesorhizobium sp. WSM3876]RWB70991.1 MAG: ABC transporter permease [Mesorhizobium sp.]RWB89253.1 MAG: ABC transporter permease [Mesorhizobium sp.]RWE26717.1 MAG: ABC transporter permease [Mesorhizobium sp.]
MNGRASLISRVGNGISSLGAARFGLALIALALILLFVFWLRPNMASYNGLRLLLNLSPVLVFTALAQMFVMTAGDIDLGVGTFVGLIDCIAAGLLNEQPVTGVALLVACPIAYSLIGALIHLRQLPSIVVTLGASFVWLGVALTVLPMPGGTVPAALTELVRLRPPLVPMPIVLTLVPMVAAHLILNKMSYGVVLRGIGGSLAAVERAGRSTLRARMTLYGLAGICGLCAGLCLAATTTTGDANVGRGLTLVSIGAVIIGGGEFVGGIVSPIGTVFGALIMLLSGSLLSFASVPPAWQYSIQGAILLVILALRIVSWRPKAA